RESRSLKVRPAIVWHASRPIVLALRPDLREPWGCDMDKLIVKLAPSILDADFARLGQQVAEAERAGADRIHVDVMDGHFVPNLTMGPAIVKSLRRVTQLPLETHLMISNPDYFLEEFAKVGSDPIVVHWEGNNNL